MKGLEGYHPSYQRCTPNLAVDLCQGQERWLLSMADASAQVLTEGMPGLAMDRTIDSGPWQAS